MGRLAYLKTTLPSALAQPGVSHVVVDFSCPDGTGDWVEQHFPQVKVVRVPGKAHFSASEARNAGAAAAGAPWLFFRDADIAVTPAFAGEVLPLLRDGGHYRAVERAIGPLAGALICSRADFERVGGYDEVMQGWGYEDWDMYIRLVASGSEQRAFPARLLGWIDHGDELRVANQKIKNREVSRVTNTLYSMAKLDLGAAAGRPLDLAARRRLYAEVQRALPALVRAKGRKTFRIGGPGGASLRYKLDTTTGTVERVPGD
jgi:hypothetical protein